MPAIGAALGHHLDFSARRAREISAGVIRGYAELFQAFDWRRNNRAGCGHKSGVVSAAALHVAGGVSTVNHVRVLIGASSRNGPATKVPFASSSSTIEGRCVTTKSRQLREEV